MNYKIKNKFKMEKIIDKKIFISYCHKNETVVDEIDNSFAEDGVKLIRDKREVKYKDSFKEFMKKIRFTDSVLMVISDDYLKSKNCMYEVLETLKDDNYKERIYPIIIDAKIYSPSEKLEYLNYWKNEYSILKNKISKHELEEVISVAKDLKIIRDINGSITDFISIISDFKNIPFCILKKNKFKEIKQKLGIKMVSKNKIKHEILNQEDFSHAVDKRHSDQIVSKNKIKYEILNREDFSHAGAKRYSAQILIESKYSRDEIKFVIKEVTEKLINLNYYRNKKLKNIFRNKQADVVWLFVANSPSDINNANWICRTSWINSDLDEAMRPLDIQGNDSIDKIIIDWNDKYKELSEFYDKFSTTKDKFLSLCDSLINRNEIVVKPLINLFNTEHGDFKSVMKHVSEHEQAINVIYEEVNNLPFAPPDCKELDKLTQSYFALSHNLFLYYSNEGVKTWSEDNRIYLMKQDIIKLNELLEKIRIERNKL